MTAAAQTDAAWKRLNRRVHARARELGIDEQARRALQTRVTGKASCRDMSPAELRRVIAAMSGSGGSDALPDSDLLPKLRALWISGWHLGVVRDRTDAGLAAWLRRQAGIDSATWATPAHLVAAIEALRGWLHREAGVSWKPYRAVDESGRAKDIDRPRARVLEAQWAILHGLGLVRIADRTALSAYACAHAGLARTDSHTALSDKQADALIRHFGDRIRAAAGSAP